ncbi:hypothetical protein HAX54_037797, partial [Datura stramonium]|nr:hypothetical protein [Datura stramonium]
SPSEEHSAPNIPESPSPSTYTIIDNDPNIVVVESSSNTNTTTNHDTSAEVVMEPATSLHPELDARITSDQPPSPAEGFTIRSSRVTREPL